MDDREMEHPPVNGPEEPPPVNGPEEPPTVPLWGWEPPRAPGTALGSPPPERKRGRAVVAAILAGLVLVSGGIGIGWVLTRSGSPTAAKAPLSGAPTATPPIGRADQGLNALAVAAR